MWSQTKIEEVRGRRRERGGKRKEGIALFPGSLLKSETYNQCHTESHDIIEEGRSKARCYAHPWVASAGDSSVSYQVTNRITNGQYG